MQKGQKFILKTFNGTHSSPIDCDDRENYWKLISKEATLINFAHEKSFPNPERVLVQFKANVVDIGLECQNTEPNSLWILKTDLEHLT